MSILLTAFETFGGRETNLSWQAVSAIEDERVVKACLPVSFKRAPEMLKKMIDELSPDVLLMTGFSAKRDKVCVERVAINIMDAKNPDNDGFKPIDEAISSQGLSAFFSTLPIKEIVRAVNELGIPCGVSNTAGTYVCNTVMYSAMEYIEVNKIDCRAGFIHFPEIEVVDAVSAIRAVIRTI